MRKNRSHNIRIYIMSGKTKHDGITTGENVVCLGQCPAKVHLLNHTLEDSNCNLFALL